MRIDDEQKWWNVVNHIEEYVSRAEVEIATAEALDRIKTVSAGKNAAYAWSGGKDSLVIADLSQKAGLAKSYCIVTELEYPEYLKFMQEKKPPNCEIINAGFNLDYLARHPEMIFPKGKLFQRWYNQVQHKTHARYMQKNNLDVVILGRRKIDGNICGKDGLKTNKDGRITYSPIYDWSHEMLFAYLHYHNIELPFIYKWCRGFYNGTHIWAERKVDSVAEGYSEVWEIDPQVVIEAAKAIPSAKEFLQCKLQQRKSAN